MDEPVLWFNFARANRRTGPRSECDVLVAVRSRRLPEECPGARCEEHQLTTNGVGTGIDLDDIQTTPDMSIVDDLADGETEATSVLHRVDDLRIVRLDDAIGAKYRIEERDAGRWEGKTTLTREQILLVAGMVNKQWGGD